MLIIRRINKLGFAVAFFNGSKEWRSGESACLPPMWPGFKSRRQRHMWVEFVVGSLLCSQTFFSEYSGFPLSSKTNISKFQFDHKSGTRRTTLWVCYLQFSFYLFVFIYLFTTAFIVISLTEVITECAYLMLFSSNVNLQSCQTRGKLWPWLKMIFIMI